MELLAPARDFDALRAAVQNGADAVYLGGSAFSARAAANSFDDGALREATDYAHVRNVKIYLAVNTLVKEMEWPALCRLLETACRIGVDALIVQDLGVAAAARCLTPELPLHASTQMTLYDADGVAQAKELGFRRVVLAREVSRERLASIRRETDCELEYFVHGALCICYSGQCLMSSMYGGRSGNRGACAQPCRLPYTLLCDGKPVAPEGPILSPKDLCLADRVSQLRECGVDSLKIEGRLKGPEYVAAVTRVYRHAIDGVADDGEIRDMLSFFSRGGSCAGYFDGPRYGAMMSGDAQTKITATARETKATRQTYADGVETVRRPATVRARLAVGEAATLSVRVGDCEATVTGPVCETATHRPLTVERVTEQLEKLGGTPFRAEKTEVASDGEATVPIAALNDMRRRAVETLTERLASRYRRPIPPRAMESPERTDDASAFCLSAWVTTAEQAAAAVENGIKRLYLPLSLRDRAPEPEDVVYVLPPIVTDPEALRRRLRDGDRVLVDNLGLLHAFRSFRRVGGPRLNVMNPYAAALLRERGVESQFLSPELNLSELRTVEGILPSVVTVYGRQPLMLSENCFIRSAYRCGCKNHTWELEDRKGERLPILTEDCRSVILNAKPLYLADRVRELQNLKINEWNLYFTVENQKICGKIIREYSGALAGETAATPKQFTRGHFYRGVR